MRILAKTTSFALLLGLLFSINSNSFAQSADQTIINSMKSIEQTVSSLNGDLGYLNGLARSGRNPQTGKEIKIAAKNTKTKVGNIFDDIGDAIAACAKGGGDVCDEYDDELLRMAKGGHQVDSFFDIMYKAVGTDNDITKFLTATNNELQTLRAIAQEIRKEVQDKKNKG